MSFRTCVPFGILALATACAGSSVDEGVGPEPTGSSAEPVACLTGPGVTVLTELPIAAQPVVDGSDVIVSTGSALMRVPLGGGEPDTLAEAESPTTPIVLGSTAYFAAEMLIGSPDANGKQQSARRTFSVALTGGEPSSIEELGIWSPTVGDGKALYLDTYANTFKRWDPATDTLADLTVDAGLSIDATAIYGDYVYVAAQDLTLGGFANGVIGRIPKLGGSLEILVTGLGHPWSLVASKAGLYWSEDPPALYGAGSGRIAKSSLSGTNVITIAPSGAGSLAFSDGRLYAALANEIDSFPANGGAPTVIATDLSSPGLLAIAGGNVIWVDPAEKSRSSTEQTFVMTACVTPAQPAL